METENKAKDRLQELQGVLNRIQNEHGQEEGVEISVKFFQSFAEGVITSWDYKAAMNCADSMLGMMKYPLEPYINIFETATLDDLFEDAKREIYSIATEKALAAYIILADPQRQTKAGKICDLVSGGIMVDAAQKRISAELKGMADTEDTEDKKIAESFLLGLYYSSCRRTDVVWERAYDDFAKIIKAHPNDDNLLLWESTASSMEIAENAWEEENVSGITRELMSLAYVLKQLSNKYDPRHVDNDIGSAIAMAISYTRLSAARLDTSFEIKKYFSESE